MYFKYKKVIANYNYICNPNKIKYDEKTFFIDSSKFIFN